MIILENDLKRHMQLNRLKFHQNIEKKIKDKNLTENEFSFLQQRIINKNSVRIEFMYIYAFAVFFISTLMTRVMGIYSAIILLAGIFLPILLSRKDIYFEANKLLKTEKFNEYIDELFESQVVDQNTLSYFKSKYGKNALQVILTAKENVTYKDIYKYEIYLDKNSNIKDISDCL